MPGKVISKANLNKLQAMHDTLAGMGAMCGSATKRATKDQGLYDRIDAVRSAVMGAVSIAEGMDQYPYLEDIYDTFAIVEIGDAYFCATYTIDSMGVVTLQPRADWTQVQEVWQPVNSILKAGALPPNEVVTHIDASIKAMGDRTLELRVAWGYDGHGEQFTPATDFDLENYGTPPVAYYHGYTADGTPAPRPIFIGKTIKRENRADGHYLITKLNNKPEADKVWAAALKGKAVVSPGTAGHLRRKNPDGTLTYWPIIEVSAWDYAPNRKQAHPGSLAFPVLKALYTEAGMSLPADLIPPEAAGEAARGVDDPSEVGRIIARTVAALLLETHES